MSMCTGKTAILTKAVHPIMTLAMWTHWTTGPSLKVELFLRLAQNVSFRSQAQASGRWGNNNKNDSFILLAGVTIVTPAKRLVTGNVSSTESSRKQEVHLDPVDTSPISLSSS